MAKSSKKITIMNDDSSIIGYDIVLCDVIDLLESARSASARTINTIITATYWKIGQRIVESEQGGNKKAEYGEQLIDRLSNDLTKRFGRGFKRRNLFQMRAFYIAYPEIVQTVSAQLDTNKIVQTASAQSIKTASAQRFPLSWSHYVRLLAVKKSEARIFYETEALRGGWSVRQLDRQISTLFYERTLLSKNKAAMLKKGAEAKPEDAVTPEEEIKDPFVLEFLNLKDEYSENDMEEALIQHLEKFLLELGGDFAFIGRQRRLRIGDQWFVLRGSPIHSLH